MRPELRAAVRRWREALAGLAVLGLGVWLALASYGLVAWLGIAFCLSGVVLALAGWQRGRFRTGGGGPGVVTVDEGRLTYFGLLTGGSVAVRDLALVALDPGGRPPHWVLQTAEETVCIPLTAEGTDALFDVLAGLPGIDMSHILAVVRQPPAAWTVLWRAPAGAETPRIAQAGQARAPGAGPH